MKVIGITGGIGAGKTEVLNIIRESCRCFIVIADLAAKEIEQSGHPCYDALVQLLGIDVLDEKREIDKKKMAAKIFAEGASDLLKQVNEIIHPAVKQHILKLIEEKRSEGSFDYFFIEAALLVEDGYTKICDELWYVRAADEVRIRRLMQSRGYSRQKAEQIMESQLDDAAFLSGCQVVINNDGELTVTKQQIQTLLKMNK